MPAEDSFTTSYRLLIYYVEKKEWLFAAYASYSELRIQNAGHTGWAEWRLLISVSEVVFIDSNGAISSMAAYLVLVIPHWTASIYVFS